MPLDLNGATTSRAGHHSGSNKRQREISAARPDRDGRRNGIPSTRVLTGRAMMTCADVADALKKGVRAITKPLVQYTTFVSTRGGALRCWPSR